MIPKAATPDGGLPKVRPICLLDDIGKALKRILADRIVNWMEENPQAQLTENQFGFRRQRSTCDAIMKVKELIQEVLNKGGLAVAVSLDIANAFNLVPWTVIREALRTKGFPEYIRRIIDSYLSERYITYPTNSGRMGHRAMQAGVPQGFVLGPLLWNLAYDNVLRVNMEPDCSVVCYADDTLIVATADNVITACTRANIQTSRVIRRIRDLGLTVSESKTEAVVFHGKRRPKVIPDIVVVHEYVQVKDHVKYLGIIIE